LSKFVAEALQKAKKLADEHENIIRSQELTRREREKLQERGFLRQIIRGWYYLVPETTPEGDTTSWYINCWNFFKRYLPHRFGNKYCLSPETSLFLQTDANQIPNEIVVRVAEGGTTNLDLPGGNSALIYQEADAVPDRNETVRGLKVFPLALALCKVPRVYFENHTTNVQTALSQVDFHALLECLLEQGAQSAAGRLAGAYKEMDKQKESEEIEDAMQSAGHKIQIENPFPDQKTISPIREQSSNPVVDRFIVMWNKMSDVVKDNFPAPPENKPSQNTYLQRMDAIYTHDAYHSLSIEGYQVDESLIEKVRDGEWDPESNEDDKEKKDALAAKGYENAYDKVKDSVQKMYESNNPAQTVEKDHQKWFRELFSPMVQANLLEPKNLAGYRRSPVYIQDSEHIPPRWETVSDLMNHYFEKLKNENHAGVRAVLGHFFFGYIHPYFDGNGRIARFVMNTMLASGGYPWTVIPVEDRSDYMDCLEIASTEKKIFPFTKFIQKQMVTVPIKDAWEEIQKESKKKARKYDVPRDRRKMDTYRTLESLSKKGLFDEKDLVKIHKLQTQYEKITNGETNSDIGPEDANKALALLHKSKKILNRRE
jgi:Fic family protein